MLQWPMNTSAIDFPSYRGYRFPAAIISHCVWLHFRFSLSYRDVEELMASGIMASSDFRSP
jgi:transposase-like protein